MPFFENSVELGVNSETDSSVKNVAMQIIDGIKREYSYFPNDGPINEHTPISSMGLDSLDHAELLMWLEKEFGVEISDERAMTWHNILDAAEYISKNI